MLRRLPLIPCYLLGFGIGFAFGLVDDFVGLFMQGRRAR